MRVFHLHVAFRFRSDYGLPERLSALNSLTQHCYTDTQSGSATAACVQESEIHEPKLKL